MSGNSPIASIAVRHLGSAVQWYAALLGRPADVCPMRGEAEWRFERGGWLQIHERFERAGCGAVTMAVDSLDEQIAHLQRLGIHPGKPLGSPRVRVVMIEDPDGNSIAFAEVSRNGPNTPP